MPGADAEGSAAGPARPLPADGPVRPLTEVRQNTVAFLREPMIVPTGFREYDVRWRFPDEINLPGVTALGLGLGTQIRVHGLPPEIVAGFDYRSYSLAVQQALVIGLVQAGIRVHDIGPALTPMAYFARDHLGVPAVAMVTASHNPNGWTGVKMGLEPPLTHGPDEIAALRGLVLGGGGVHRPGGGVIRVDGIAEAYLDDLAGDFRLSRPLRVVCATGNGTAGLVAPRLLERLGAEVVTLHTTPDFTFPHYNPDPEALAMLDDMARAVTASGADLALGFDGDGDRCGVVDDTGTAIFADRIGLLIARDLARRHRGARFVADVKSTGLFATDPVLAAHGATTEYWKTGHSHMKRRIRDTGALAGFERSGHVFLAPPVGRGYDCAMRVAVALCRMLDAVPGRRMSDLRRDLPQTFASPTMSPACPDTEKYPAAARIAARLVALADAGGTLGGSRIAGTLTVNGIRVMLEGGGWALVRASSNTPNLVVVCESLESAAHLRAIFADVDRVIRTEPAVGGYDQSL